MSLRFLHPPRTGGSSLRRGWAIPHHEEDGHRLPRFPKPENEWRYGFTRNPWDRVVSLYCLSHPTDAEREENLFREWVLNDMEGGRHGIEAIQHYARPTWDWLEGADFIGRFENREEDLANLAKILNRPYPFWSGEVVHLAKSRDRKPYQAYYDEETELYVARRYAIDIEIFEYSFESQCLS